jgi:hypothetical protein
MKPTIDSKIASRLMRLKDCAEITVPGLGVIIRMEDEFKVSPHGEHGSYDKDASWVTREEIKDIIRSA